MQNPLNRDITALPGVGQKRAQLYKKLGVATIHDLLRLYPHGYLDLTPQESILTAPLYEPVAVRAAVISKATPARVSGRMTITKVRAGDSTCELMLTFFNNPYTPGSLELSREYLFYGKLQGSLLRREMTAPQVFPASASQSLQPVYPLTAGLSSRMISAGMKEALRLVDSFPDILPPALTERYHLMNAGDAIHAIHFPKNRQMLDEARRRLGFEELLTLHLALHRMRSRSREETSVRITPKSPEAFEALLPFTLTNAQRRVIAECTADMAKGVPMNRLIQGDVGSGKTAVAAYCAWLCAQSGYTACMMAPTEVLANQHARNLTKLLAPAGVRVGLLTGSLGAKARRAVLASLAGGEIDLLVGTHAVLTDDVAFAKLGLVITDEQHRFGVEQRARLFQKGDNPHLLVMSATPIPRTLALILYGDLDISVIDELPPGRTPVETYLITSDKRDRALGYIRRHLDAGQQGYIVCPVIEEGETELKSAVAYAEELSLGPFLGYRTALLHGRMKPAERERVMTAFSKGEIQLLISTTVIEVGVDVPGAVIMLIENAERFGLSQLHQLRGRVGRSTKRSTCILLSDAAAPATKARLQIICRTQDGFRIAEEDLTIRGPGELLGNIQHGLAPQRLGALLSDVSLLGEVREAAGQLGQSDPDLSRSEHLGLRGAVDRLLGEERSGSFN